VRADPSAHAFPDRRRRRSDLPTDALVAIGDLRHHPRAREEACERGAAIAPAAPSLVGPALVLGAGAGRREKSEGSEEMRVAVRGGAGTKRCLIRLGATASERLGLVRPAPVTWLCFGRQAEGQSIAAREPIELSCLRPGELLLEGH
jgi:hypothetical protein